MLIMLAYERGWQPAGTQPPNHWDRIGKELGAERTVGPLSIIDTGNGPIAWPQADYVSGRGQRIEADDARAFAKVLFSIVDDLPNHDPLEDKATASIEAPGFPLLRLGSLGLVMQPFEVFGGPNKPGFIKLIAYLQAGSCFVW
jgi:hypothetical protein